MKEKKFYSIVVTTKGDVEVMRTYPTDMHGDIIYPIKRIAGYYGKFGAVKSYGGKVYTVVDNKDDIDKAKLACIARFVERHKKLHEKLKGRLQDVNDAIYTATSIQELMKH